MNKKSDAVKVLDLYEQWKRKKNKGAPNPLAGFWLMAESVGVDCDLYMLDDGSMLVFEVNKPTRAG